MGLYMECEGTNVYIKFWWVQPITFEHEHMRHWLDTNKIEWSNWIKIGETYTSRVLGVTFVNAEDATAFKLKFGL
jgi:hypothetical protein